MVNIVAVLFSILVTSCATRTPEDPSGGRGNFIPATTPGVVLENLQAALRDKNTENYMLCLADDATRSRYPFVFEPSAEAKARYQSLFIAWNRQSERQAFVSLTSRLTLDQFPDLSYQNLNINYSSPDSTIYVTDYQLVVEHGIASIPTVLHGTMVLTVTPEVSGLWSISRWADAKRTSDTVESTWSLLKAAASN
jgi:hypothetical protein